MHELSIAESLVRIAAEHASRQGSSKVVSLDLVLGTLAGVQPDALTFCFPLSMKPWMGALIRTLSARFAERK